MRKTLLNASSLETFEVYGKCGLDRRGSNIFGTLNNLALRNAPDLRKLAFQNSKVEFL